MERDISDSPGTALEPAPVTAVVLRPPVREAPAYSDADYTIGVRTAEGIIAGQKKAANTDLAYARAVRDYEAFCQEQGRVAFPGTEHTLLEFVSHLMATPARPRSAGGGKPRAPSSIRQAISAIRGAHVRKGYPDTPPLTTNLRDLMKAYQKQWSEAGGKKAKRAPVAADALPAILAQCTGTDPASVRDRALILAGVYGMFRRSELSALDIADFRRGPTGRTFLFLRSSKTDQQARGAEVDIIHDRCAGGACPACCVQAWIDLLASRGITEGALFRGVDRNGRIGGEPRVLGRFRARLTGEAVDDRVRILARRAGLPQADTYGGHSLRSGGATAAFLAGRMPSAISAGGRWADGSTQVMHYIRAAEGSSALMEGIQEAWEARKAAGRT
jgi:integrase